MEYDRSALIAQLLLSVHLLYYTRETIRKQLELAGFQVSQIQPHWQSLRLSYILERMTPYVGAARFAGRAVSALGAANLPIRYNMGQTLVVARKSP